MASMFEKVAALLVLAVICAPSSFSITLRVGPPGKGNYSNIQDAIDAVPHNNTDPVDIHVEPGIYREKILVPANKPFITLVGAGANSTIITWNDFGSVMDSPTAIILASDFVAINIAFENTHCPGSQAPALRVSADRVAFYSCKMRSFQDTLMDHSGRHYYKDSYIEGGTDFICGDGRALFENCEIRSISRNGGAVTAQKRNSTNDNGAFSFVSCNITGTGPAILGQPWGNFSTVVFANSYMSGEIVPLGWDDWGKPSTHSSVFYGEYNCSGSGSDRSKRVSWSRNLNFHEVVPFLNISMINGETWLKPHVFPHII